MISKIELFFRFVVCLATSPIAALIPFGWFLWAGLVAFSFFPRRRVYQCTRYKDKPDYYFILTKPWFSNKFKHLAVEQGYPTRVIDPDTGRTLPWALELVWAMKVLLPDSTLEPRRTTAQLRLREFLKDRP